MSKSKSKSWSRSWVKFKGKFKFRVKVNVKVKISDEIIVMYGLEEFIAIRPSWKGLWSGSRSGCIFKSTSVKACIVWGV